MDLNMTVGQLIEAGGEVKSPQRVNSDKAYKKRMSQQDPRSFVQVNDRGVVHVKSTLNLTQAGTLFSLMAYLDDKDGNLVFRGERLGTEQLSKLLSVSKTSLKRNISELVNLGYVIDEKVGRKVFYSVNPQIAKRGVRTEKDLFSKLYNVHLRELIQKLTVQELGFLFLMIPYFNTKYYTLCQNPYELNSSKVELFDRERFAEEVGLSLVQVKRLIANLLKKQALIGLRTCRTAIIISPKLVSRQQKFVSIEEVTDIIGNELNVKERMQW
ncbi:helix-turn-helix domain-containing protein [Fictibacillus sp. WQ 8-8]|uniref:helix-turn-helix domain-containing protein n=1 Tax=Fictibacillus sp. WQ 8-8 TaxID=2938788 RepID=UPI00210DB05B|nr:helix-turn-helix domain-containing protein [Fictibacillus sp. WQ 8-8]MCQ6265599.1 helix-turn-helix domain-containing protein [Fictibacillus sp. WQ 8-8]